MKRLTPFDSLASRVRRGETHARSSHAPQDIREPAVHEVASGAVERQCAPSLEPNPTRTALYAVVSRGWEGARGVLHVQETPLEIVPIRNTELMHFYHPESGPPGDDLLVTITEHTCFDVDRPYELLEPGTPIIVVGIDCGETIEAEIIADMHSEARYRPLILRYQESRDWYRSERDQSRSGGA